MKLLSAFFGNVKVDKTRPELRWVFGDDVAVAAAAFTTAEVCVVAVVPHLLTAVLSSPPQPWW